MTLLNLARMTDPAFSMGRKDKANLSLQALPDLVKDTGLKSTVAELIDNALKATEFARDWRDRFIAHRDLGIRPVSPMEVAKTGVFGLRDRPFVPTCLPAEHGATIRLRTTGAAASHLDHQGYQGRSPWLVLMFPVKTEGVVKRLLSVFLRSSGSCDAAQGRR